MLNLKIDTRLVHPSLDMARDSQCPEEQKLYGNINIEYISTENGCF